MSDDRPLTILLMLLVSLICGMALVVHLADRDIAPFEDHAAATVQAPRKNVVALCAFAQGTGLAHCDVFVSGREVPVELECESEWLGGVVCRVARANPAVTRYQTTEP